MSKNVGASVRDRLRNHARETGLDVLSLLNRYAQERFLYRLSLSEHARRFCLKGGLSFALVTGGDVFRPTNDVDLNGEGRDGIAEIERMIRDVCAIEAPDDGVAFDLAGLKVRKEREGTVPGGKVEFAAAIGTSRVAMRVDVGFGNAVTPTPQVVEFPSMLDFPAPKVMVYPLETTIAEKLHAMAAFGLDNTRLKDYYDLWVVSTRLSHLFDRATLALALRRTFAIQERPLPEAFEGLSDSFVERKTREWTAYLGKTRLRHAPPPLAETVAEIRKVVLPALESAREEDREPPKP